MTVVVYKGVEQVVVKNFAWLRVIITSWFYWGKNMTREGCGQCLG